MIRLIAIVVSLFATTALAEKMKLAVTTSFHNSGLSDLLLPVILEDTGLEVQLLIVGTGQALRLGEAGDVDAILVHSEAAEEVFVENGFAPYRREIMYNDFVVVGPQTDPADIASADTAVDALTRIAIIKAPFVSRGDASGTHKKELFLWTSTKLDPKLFGTWYNAVGAGMGASLNTASGLGAYILTDRASWLNFANKGELDLLFEGDPILFNQYAYLPIDSKRHPHVNIQAQRLLESWLTSKRAETLINGYTVDGTNVFVFNAFR
jgi:tungstate transport system substrate-binding protein